ncbi:MAG: zinc ribbon domain-containing protein, partial [Terriglobia bacterium]
MFCTHCGTPMEKTDKFCSKCGAPVAGAMPGVGAKNFFRPASRRVGRLPLSAARRAHARVVGKHPGPPLAAPMST